jgi:hypothetical protein
VAGKKKQKQKAKLTTSTIPSETRQALMMRAKERSIKNFRVLNKEELGQVLAEGITPEQIEKVVSGAVARWKAGWGSKKNKPSKS